MNNSWLICGNSCEKNLFGHFCNNDSPGHSRVQRLGRAASYARDGDRMRDAGQHISTYAVRLAPNDDDALGLGLKLEQIS